MSDPPKPPGTVTFGITSTPFAHEPDHAREFYEALGRVVCLWGRFEHHLTMDLMFFLSAPQCAAVKDQLPVSWSRKVKLWRKIFQQVPEFEAHRESAISFIAQADEVATERNILQHSHWFGFKNHQPLTAEFRSLKEKGGKWLFPAWEITIDDLREIARKADNLNTRLLVVTWFLGSLNPVHLPEGDKPQGL